MTTQSASADANRRAVWLSLGVWLLPISACESKPMYGTFEVVLFSYLDRPIFEVLVNGQEIGAAGPYPYSGRGSMQGPIFQLGPTKVSWRYSDTGETVHAKNTPMLEIVRSKDQFLAVHVYPDDTVELLTSEHFPGLSPSGQALDRAWRTKHAQ